MKPANTVSIMLIIISIIAPFTGNTEILLIFTRFFIIMLIGIFNRIVTTIPITPAVKPSIRVSALNTLDISFLDAPIALRIPISLVLYNTEI